MHVQLVLTCVAVSVYAEALEKNVENSLIGLEIVAGGVEKAKWLESMSLIQIKENKQI